MNEFEDRLRSSLNHEAAGEMKSVDAWAENQRRLGTKGGHLRPVLAAASVAAVLVGAVVGFSTIGPTKGVPAAGPAPRSSADGDPADNPPTPSTTVWTVAAPQIAFCPPTELSTEPTYAPTESTVAPTLSVGDQPGLPTSTGQAQAPTRIPTEIPTAASTGTASPSSATPSVASTDEPDVQSSATSVVAPQTLVYTSGGQTVTAPVPLESDGMTATAKAATGEVTYGPTPYPSTSTVRSTPNSTPSEWPTPPSQEATLPPTAWTTAMLPSEVAPTATESPASAPTVWPGDDGYPCSPAAPEPTDQQQPSYQPTQPVSAADSTKPSELTKTPEVLPTEVDTASIAPTVDPPTSGG